MERRTRDRSGVHSFDRASVRVEPIPRADLKKASGRQLRINRVGNAIALTCPMSGKGRHRLSIRQAEGRLFASLRMTKAISLLDL